MKSFAILAFLFIGTIAALLQAMAFHVNEEWHVKFVEASSDAVKQCGKELNLNPDIALKYTTDDTIDKKQVGCLAACVFKNLGVLVDDKFLNEKAFEIIDKVHANNPAAAEAGKKAFAECTSKVSTTEDACTKSLKHVECFYADS